MKWSRHPAYPMIVTAVFLLHTMALAIPKKKRGDQNGPPSVRAYWQPTAGKVGYHMDSGLFIYSTPDCGEPLHIKWLEEVGGQLPPGLSRQRGDKFAGGGSTHYEGTPEQPGDWSLQVKIIGITCKSKNLTYDDHDVTIQFHIEGDAPRKVH